MIRDAVLLGPFPRSSERLLSTAVIANDITDLIGNMPLLRLNRVGRDPSAPTPPPS